MKILGVGTDIVEVLRIKILIKNKSVSPLTAPF